jgi:hypothetical protein
VKTLLALCFLATSASAGTDADFARSLSVDPLIIGDQAPPPAQGKITDGLGRAVSPEASAAYDRVVKAVKKRTLSQDDKVFLLTVLNDPPVAAGSFKNREELALFFAQRGVGVGGGSLAGTDLWRLVRSARAAAQAYKIPPAILLCLTFQESGFVREASAWTTSAKGVGQMTNPAVEYIVWMIKNDKKRIKPQTEEYARLLGATMPDRVLGTPDVDKLTKELDALRKSGAPKATVQAKKEERLAAIRAHKDEPGSIYNIETNFGLAAAFLADIRYAHLQEVPEERKGWLSAVGGYNQGMGIINDLIYKVYQTPAAYNAASIDEIFSPATAARLSISKDFQEEMLGEVGNVRRCALP